MTCGRPLSMYLSLSLTHALSVVMEMNVLFTSQSSMNTVPLICYNPADGSDRQRSADN